MNFEVTVEQQKQVNDWYKEISLEIIDNQRQEMMADDFDLLTSNGTVPYYGASGGGLTYSFTPTSFGLITIVTEAITGKELDITDYSDW